MAEDIPHVTMQCINLKQNEAERVRAESTHKGVNQRLTGIAQQQRPQSPTVTLTWHLHKYKVRKLHQRYILKSFKR